MAMVVLSIFRRLMESCLILRANLLTSMAGPSESVSMATVLKVASSPLRSTHSKRSEVLPVSIW
jgi:hypothetical protein